MPSSGKGMRATDMPRCDCHAHWTGAYLLGSFVDCKAICGVLGSAAASIQVLQHWSACVMGLDRSGRSVAFTATWRCGGGTVHQGSFPWELLCS